MSAAPQKHPVPVYEEVDIQLVDYFILKCAAQDWTSFMLIEQIFAKKTQAIWPAIRIAKIIGKLVENKLLEFKADIRPSLYRISPRGISLLEETEKILKKIKPFSQKTVYAKRREK